MDRMRFPPVSLAILVFFTAFIIIPGSFARQKELNVHFIWAFGALVGPEMKRPVLLFATGHPTLSTLLPLVRVPPIVVLQAERVSSSTPLKFHVLTR